MGLSWINPLYLTGILLLALPVLIHLVQQHRVSGIKFPSLMFLRQIPLREKRRLEIRHWLLLLLRCLLLLLIVLAFARPFLSAGAQPATLDQERSDSIILLDRSYSMGVADRWQQAQQLALERVAGKNSYDRIGVVVFDEQTEVLSDLTSDSENLRGLIRRQSPGLGSTRLRLAIEQAARLLAGSNASRKQILLISDYQAAGATAVARITRDIELVALPINSTEVANASLNSVSIAASARGRVDEIALEVELTNHAQAALDQRIRLEVDGRELARRDLRLEPGTVVTETFEEVSIGGALLRGVVSLDDDALNLDNRLHFVYSSKQQVPVLLVESSPSRANQSIYLERALKLSRDPVFRLTRKTWSELAPEQLSTWAVIVVNDAALPGGALGEALRKFVTAGGGLLVATGDRVQGYWPSAADGYVPGNLLRQVDSKPGKAYNMAQLDPNHRLTALLGPEANIDLSLARIYSYRNIEPRAGDRILGRYNDGNVALLERLAGQGRVLVLTTTLDTHWADLAVQPVFLPFLHHALRYLSAFESYPKRFEVGSVVDVLRYARALAGSDAIVAAGSDSALVVETPDAAEIRLDRESPLLTVTQTGFYQVHRATPAGSEVVLAANVNTDESNPKSLDVTRFVEEINDSAVAPPAAGLPTRRQAAEYEEQQQLWRLVLIAALVLMLLEALSANWIAGKRSVRA